MTRRRGLLAPPASRARRRAHGADSELLEGDLPAGLGRRDRRAINAATRRDVRLREFRIDAVTGPHDALGEASVALEFSGQSAASQGVSADIIEAAGLAYVGALSNVARRVIVAAEAAQAAREQKLASTS